MIYHICKCASVGREQTRKRIADNYSSHVTRDKTLRVYKFAFFVFVFSPGPTFVNVCACASISRALKLHRMESCGIR